jgi:hypothetical protein
LSLGVEFATNARFLRVDLRSDDAIAAPDPERRISNVFRESPELTLFFNRGDSGSINHEDAIERRLAT